MSVSEGCNAVMQSGSAWMLLAVVAVAVLAMLCRPKTSRKKDSAK